MQLAYQIFTAISIAAFLFYGVACLVSDSMIDEFERFELGRFRRLTGGLEVLGALGLVAGYFIAPLTLAAAGGLILLMTLGVGTRLRVGDSLVETLPAIVLLLVNVFIFYYAFQHSA